MPKLVLPIKFSQMYGFFLVFIHAASVCLISLMQIPFWAKLVGLGIVALSGYKASQKTSTVQEIRHVSENLWEVKISGRERRAMLSEMSWVTPYAAVLLFKLLGENKRLSVVLLPDVVDATLLKQLPLYIRLQKNEKGE